MMLLVLFLCVWNTAALAQQLAFPSAEGYGRFAAGGRGGTAIAVTNLNPSGAGSLQACIDASGPRTCIFRVGGTITYTQGSLVAIQNPFLTIAGQTAPGNGIMIRGAEVQVRETHNVIIRHIRVRPGAMPEGPSSLGALEVAQSDDIMIDHCSLSWAPDDSTGVSAYPPVVRRASNVTYQWCIVTEGVGHTEGGNYDGGKVGGIIYTLPGEGVSLVHNLWANTTYRIPWIGSGDTELVNNLIYNTNSGSGILPYIAAVGGSRVYVEFRKNYYHGGPNSGGGQPRIDAYGCNFAPSIDCTHSSNSRIYVQDNFHNVYRPTGTEPQGALVAQQGTGTIQVVTSALGIGTVIPSETTAAQARIDVLAKVGARVPTRAATLDSVDQRTLNDVTNGTGRLIDHQDDVGGYPTYSYTPGGAWPAGPYTDTDGDGMADDWETAHGLNPASAADGPLITANGYSNLENFLNELAGDTAPTVSNELVLHFPLDEGTGTNADDASPYDHDGTLTNGPAWATGTVGTGAVLFDGTNDSITVPDAAHLDLTPAFSLAAWVYPTSTLSDYRAVLAKNYVYFLYASTPATCLGVQVGINGSAGATRLCHAPPPPVNTWTHLAATYDGATMRLYRNGVDVGTPLSASSTITQTTEILQIGATQYGEHFPGLIDDVRVYNYALTAPEVAGLYALRNPPDPSAGMVRLANARLGNVRLGNVSTQAPTCPGTSCESFETAGTPTSWSAGAGTPNYDNTTAPISGAQDLLLAPAAIATYDPSFNATTLYAVFKMRLSDALEGDEGVFGLARFRVGTSALGTLSIDSADSQWRCSVMGGTTNDGGSTATVVTGVTLKLRYIVGSGSNSQLTAWVWNGTDWGTQVCNIANGTNTSAVDHLQWLAPAAGESLHVDDVVTSPTDILTPG